MSVLSATLLLIMVMDPVGNLPVFLSALGEASPARYRRITLRELLFALLVLTLFLFGGRTLLAVLHISQSSLGISGGVILFVIALKMIFPDSDKALFHVPEGEPFLVPLAVPLIAGPSAMATVMLLMARAPHRWAEWLLALCCACVVTGGVLLAGGPIRRLLGLRGMRAAQRLMGMVLTTLAVQMFVDGIREAFPGAGS